ncbi:MAG: competence type IV pilus major pilin ComGC [Planctomycetota bacterium]|jgi:general secretion pathway protein G
MCRRKGFTLIELLIVVLILGALAAIAVPRIMGGANTAKINACKTNVDVLNSQIELYYSNTGDWPAALGDLTSDPNYFPDDAPECPYDGTTYTYSVVTHRVAEHGH